MSATGATLVGIIASKAGALAAKALSALAVRLHKQEFHRYAEQCKKRDIEAGYDHFKIEAGEVGNDSHRDDSPVVR